MQNYIFCGNPNNGSDERIFPDCINERLHSKEIICHDCNSNKFGVKINPRIKELFGFFMSTCGLNNAQGLHETHEGTKSLMS